MKMNWPIGVFLTLCMICLSLSFTPDDKIIWSPCPEVTPLRSFHSHNLDEFKKHFHENYVKTNGKSPFGDIPVRIPTTEQEWLKLLDTLKQAECTLVNFPFLWNKPDDNRSIKYFVKRFKAKKENVKGILFFLQGGPGAPGTAFDSHTPQYMDLLDQEWDILIPDHRGTGRSSHLHCGDNNSLASKKKEEVESCITELLKRYNDTQGLYGWSTRQAAEDIKAFANLYKKQGQQLKVVVYGVSYGTYLVNKLLNIYPDAVDGAIADSCVKMSTDFSRRELDYEENGNNLIGACKNNTFCNDKFVQLARNQYNGKTDLIEILSTIMNNQKPVAPLNMQCLPFVYQADDLRQLFVLAEANFDLRRIIFPLLYRLGRCNLNDKRWLSNFALIYLQTMTELKKGEQNLHIRNIENFSSFGSDEDDKIINGPATDSNEIMLLIVAAELNDLKNDRKYEEYEAKFNTYPPFFRFPMQTILMQLQTIGNRRYEVEKEKELATNFDGPLLMLQGTLDPQTPPSYGREWEKAFSGMKNKYFYWFKNAVHAVAFRSNLKLKKDLNCGSVIAADFIKNIGNGKESAEPSEEALKCWRNDEYLDSPEVDFRYFFFDFSKENEIVNLSPFIQSMKLVFLLDIDMWEGIPNFTVLDVFGVLLIVLLLGIGLCLLMFLVCVCCTIVLSSVALLIVGLAVRAILSRRRKTIYEKQSVEHAEDESNPAAFETKKLINKAPESIYDNDNYNDGSINFNYENA